MAKLIEEHEKRKLEEAKANSSNINNNEDIEMLNNSSSDMRQEDETMIDTTLQLAK
jgi:hypothetical protein